jgi:hypothetical protein
VPRFDTRFKKIGLGLAVLLLLIFGHQFLQWRQVTGDAYVAWSKIHKEFSRQNELVLQYAGEVAKFIPKERTYYSDLELQVNLLLSNRKRMQSVQIQEKIQELFRHFYQIARSSEELQNHFPLAQAEVEILQIQRRMTVEVLRYNSLQYHKGELQKAFPINLLYFFFSTPEIFHFTPESM